jgi:dipeptidyl aminopeptidase/acylaminoacyl peptidase
MVSVVLGAVLQIGDMAKIVDLEEPAITPNGTRVALVAITQSLARATYVNSLIVVDVRSGTTRTVVRGNDVAVPRWSPQGTLLAYLARSSHGIRQLFVRAPSGRTT